MNTDSHVLVFGASGVIGGAIATAFGQQGWTVGLHYHHHPSAALDRAASIHQAGGHSAVYQADVANASQIYALVEAFMQFHNRLHALIWAVGVGHSALVMKTSSEDWTRTLQINLTGAYHVLKAVAPIFARQKEGSVVLIGSLSGEQGITGQTAYAASKAGLIGLMHTAAREWGALNIRVNVIFPGWQASPLSGPGWPSAIQHGPYTLPRTPSLQSVALSVYHLASSPEVSGQVWNLDSRIW